MRSRRWAIACTVVAMTALTACGESGGTTATGDPSTGPSGGSESTETF